jgi:hypothetical protein
LPRNARGNSVNASNKEGAFAGFIGSAAIKANISRSWSDIGLAD